MSTQAQTRSRMGDGGWGMGDTGCRISASVSPCPRTGPRPKPDIYLWFGAQARIAGYPPSSGYISYPLPHTCTNKQTHTHTHSHTHAYADTMHNTHTHIHTHTHTRTHAHTGPLTHFPFSSLPSLPSQIQGDRGSSSSSRSTFSGANRGGGGGGGRGHHARFRQHRHESYET